MLRYFFTGVRTHWEVIDHSPIGKIEPVGSIWIMPRVKYSLCVTWASIKLDVIVASGRNCQDNYSPRTNNG